MKVKFLGLLSGLLAATSFADVNVSVNDTTFSSGDKLHVIGGGSGTKTDGQYSNMMLHSKTAVTELATSFYTGSAKAKPGATFTATENSTTVGGQGVGLATPPSGTNAVPEPTGFTCYPDYGTGGAAWFVHPGLNFNTMKDCDMTDSGWQPASCKYWSWTGGLNDTPSFSGSGISYSIVNDAIEIANVTEPAKVCFGFAHEERLYDGSNNELQRIKLKNLDGNVCYLFENGSCSLQ